MLVGIDLGTTNSLVAYYKDGKPELIPNRLGEYLTPSVVAIDEDGMILVGKTARERGRLNPTAAAAVFKRSMGSDQVFDLDGMEFKAEELSRFVLRSLKEDAETYLGEPVTEAIISVPAYFNDLQRKATKRAGELAGLTVGRIINEPTAAALAHGVGQSQDALLDERCLVFDLGGGTFDISILEFFACIMEVRAIAGDNYLGGEDFTELLLTLFLQKTGISRETLTLQEYVDLAKAAEAAKCAFSESETVTMTCVIGEETRSAEFTLDEYERACTPLLDRLRRPVERALRDADVKLADIDRVILVGGATKLPVVRHFVETVFRRPAEALVDPDTAVALGAAIQCGMKARDQEIREVILTDVCPFTLGTEVMMDNGVFEETGHYLPIIERNTVIPVSRRERVATAHDNQKSISVKVLQGESRMAQNNLLLGEINMDVPQGPKGSESIDITFTYDINSLLEVEVCIVSTGETRTLIIQNGETKLSEEEAAARLKRLEYLKQNPREEEENRLQLLRAERVWRETRGVNRDLINHALMDFDHALERNDRRAIDTTRFALKQLLDRIEFGH